MILVDLLPSVPEVVVASLDKLCKVIFHDHITHIISQFINLRDFAEFDLSPPLHLAETVFDWAEIRTLRKPRHDINVMIFQQPSLGFSPIPFGAIVLEFASILRPNFRSLIV